MKHLNNIKKTGFKTPKDYFTNLEGHVLDSVKLDDSLKYKDSGFIKPESYLNNLEGIVFDKLKDENKNPKVINLFSAQNIFYLTGIAAALLIFFSVYFNSETITELDYQLVDDYIIEDIDTYELASLLTDEEIENINSEIYTETFIDENMEDYIIQNVDIEDIIEQ
jgi:hypothetical protein